MEQREAYIGFSCVSGIGPQRFKLLVEYFGSAVKAWSASLESFRSIGLGNKLTQSLDHFRQTFDPHKYTVELGQKGIRVITRIDTDFPKSLTEIPDPPIALYIKGRWPVAGSRLIAVVGTRKPTSYGKEITQKLTRDLAMNGFVIVSGMARGIDAVAHQTALEMHSPTIAVLGCGVDIIYPPEHKQLYEEIIKTNGAIISEVMPSHTVLKGLFPARNRIISGLSLGVVVTEGAEDSGSLITARYATEQGREVFAVPGPITSYLSVGPMKLLKQGAKVVTDVSDILEEFNLASSQQSNTLQRKKIIQNLESRELTVEQKQIVTLLLATADMHYDELVRLSGLASSTVGSVLTQLELSGIIRSLGNGKYRLM